MMQQQQIATKAVQTFCKVKSGNDVLFTQQQEQGGPNAENQTQKKLRPRGVGPKREEGGVVPWNFGFRGFFFSPDASKIYNSWSLTFFGWANQLLNCS